MRNLFLVLFIALIVPSFLLTGCDLFKDPKVFELEARIVALEKSNAELQEALNKNVSEYEAKIKKLTQDLEESRAENEQLKGQIDSLQTVIAHMENIEPAKGNTFTVKFAHNKLYNIPATNTLAEKVMALYKEGKVKITVNGYASKPGTAAINRWFSKERAEGVAHKLFQLGVSPDDVKLIAHGATDANQRKVVVTMEDI